MKLLLLHGLAIKASRNKLVEIKQKFDPNNVILFESGSEFKDIQNNLMATSMFAEERLVILENPPEDFVFELSLVTSHLSLVLWFDHHLKESSRILKSVKENKGEVLNFAEGREVSVFPFLDLLAARDKKAYLEMGKLKEAGFDIYYFITMIYYLLRTLAVTPKNAQPFLKEKLTRQRKNFTSDQITQLYKDILEIDIKIKSGLLEKGQAEFLIVSYFTG